MDYEQARIWRNYLEITYRVLTGLLSLTILEKQTKRFCRSFSLLFTLTCQRKDMRRSGALRAFKRSPNKLFKHSWCLWNTLKQRRTNRLNRLNQWRTLTSSVSSSELSLFCSLPHEISIKYTAVFNSFPIMSHYCCSNPWLQRGRIFHAGNKTAHDKNRQT